MYIKITKKKLDKLSQIFMGAKNTIEQYGDYDRAHIPKTGQYANRAGDNG